MKPLADQGRTMSKVLFLDPLERIEFGYLHVILQTNGLYPPSGEKN